jgi:hypothetical protein
MNLQLNYDDLPVGEIADSFYHQGTWFGRFHQIVSPQDGPIACRICDFIAFCREWNARIAADAPFEASEFEQYSDVVQSGRWFTRDVEGTIAKIEEAPNFINGEISWRLKTEESAT